MSDAKFDLVKRNCFIKKNFPNAVFSSDDADDDSEDGVALEEAEEDAPVEIINIPWTKELLSIWPKEIEMDIAPIVFDPKRFAAMTVEEAKEALLAHAMQPRSSGTVNIDEFFDGNNDPSSIATNLTGTPCHPGIAHAREVLFRVRERNEVADVRLSIFKIPNPAVPEDDYWPSAHAVYVWTNASRAEVTSWLASLNFDVIEEVSLDAVHGVERSLPVDTRLYQARW